MGPDRFDDLMPDPEVRVQAGQWVLEHQPDPASADLPHLRRGHPEQIAPVEGDPAAHPGPRQQAHDGLRGDALARAGFADEAERLARLDGEADVVDRNQFAVFGVEGDPKAVDVEQAHGFPPGPGRAGSGPPRRDQLTATLVMSPLCQIGTKAKPFTRDPCSVAILVRAIGTHAASALAN